MSFLLNCSTFETTECSVAAIFGVEPICLIKILKAINPNPAYDNPPDFIYQSVCNELGEPKTEIDVVWFHGTRVVDKESFNQFGILPKSEMKQKIESILLPLAEGLESNGENPFSLSLCGKQTEADEGPFAVLFKDVAIHSPGNHRSFISVPEMVEDIAGTWLGGNFHLLVEKYKEATTPCIVSFVSSINTFPLRNALWYLHLVATGESEIDAASIANTCFNSRGNRISPENILGIEVFTHV